MIEQSIMEQVFEAMSGGGWSATLGAILLALCAVARASTRGRVVGRPGAWLSATSALVAGIGTALAAGAVWWQAIALGVLVAPSSKGFWELVRKSLPMVGAALLVLVLVMVTVSGCACLRAVQALRSVETEADVYEVLPIVAECSQEAGELLGQCRAGGIEGLIEQAPADGAGQP